MFEEPLIEDWFWCSIWIGHLLGLKIDNMESSSWVPFVTLVLIIIRLSISVLNLLRDDVIEKFSFE